MASREDHANAKTRALMLKQQAYLEGHRTNMDQLGQRRRIKIS